MIFILIFLLGERAACFIAKSIAKETAKNFMFKTRFILNYLDLQ